MKNAPSELFCEFHQPAKREPEKIWPNNARMSNIKCENATSFFCKTSTDLLRLTWRLISAQLLVLLVSRCACNQFPFLPSFCQAEPATIRDSIFCFSQWKLLYSF